jgi:hypothetical protein
MTAISIIEWVGLGVGLVAIGLAIWHARDLTILTKSISTRYIGHFPHYFKDIVALIDEAQERIDIVCDVPGYGSFSSPQHFEEYRNKLKEKRKKGLTIETTCLSKEGRSTLFKEQFFGHGGDWEKMKHSGVFGTQLAAFLDDHQKLSELDSLTPETFLGMLEVEGNRMLTEVLSRATITETEAHVPIYFWLIDDRKAIFSIPSLSEKELEHGFATTDSNLIRSFISIRKRYNSSVAPAARPSV